jgi:hypothetical protein
MLDLFRNNAGCRLPCWWGITPGQTPWETARSFLATFALAIKQGGSLENPLYSAYFVVPKEIDPNANEPQPIAFTHNYRVTNGIVDVIEVEPGLVSNYNLSEILKVYGSPTEVRLRTFSQAREGDLQFDVVLFYPKQGILVRYATQARVANNQIRGCPQQQPATILALWSSERELTFSEAASQTVNIRNEESWPYRPLQEAVGMDVATFYQTFQSSNDSLCLETPADLWPPP